MTLPARLHKLVAAIAGAGCALSLMSCVPTARAVAGHPGLVRSPYTWWPRVVDVEGALPGTVIDCPYTHHPFVVDSKSLSGGYYYGNSSTVLVESQYSNK